MKEKEHFVAEVFGGSGKQASKKNLKKKKKIQQMKVHKKKNSEFILRDNIEKMKEFKTKNKLKDSVSKPIINSVSTNF